MTIGVDNIDRRLLNELQADFPLVAEPFAELGRRLGLGEDDVISRIRRLKAAGVIRSIAPIINYRAIGYRSTLVAMRLPASRLEEASAVVNRHPGVSHNYQRDGEFNLWFTLTVPPDTDMEDEIQRLIDVIQPDHVLDLPSLRVYKSVAFFDMAGNGSGIMASRLSSEAIDSPSSKPITDDERLLIATIQQDLSITGRPFDAMARRIRLETEQFLAAYRDLVQRGVVRRLGASLSHIRAGFVANAMVCWNVPANAIERAADIMSGYREVSHCYQRRPAAGWPYNLFTMVHARSIDELKRVIDDMRRATGIQEYKSLMTLREFKKERLKLEV